MTLKKCGVKIVGMAEEDAELQTYPFLAGVMSKFYNFPIFKNASVNAILGSKRVEGVEFINKDSGKLFVLACDTVIVTGKFRPNSSLIDFTKIEKDPKSEGPRVDMNLMTSVPNIYAAGNILRGADMNDLCAIEGRRAAQSILKTILTNRHEKKHFTSIKGMHPVRYVVPQKLSPCRKRSRLSAWFYPGVSIQLAYTVKKPKLQCWSGGRCIWEQSYSKILGNTRIPMPLGKWPWDKIDPSEQITISVEADG
jgi:hypothetical protein